MPSRVREEAGMGLVELLVAMVVMSIGIFALVAGFSSGFGSINRASKTSIAGTLADQQMEAYRNSYASIPVGATSTTKTVSGQTYWIGRVVALNFVCRDGSLQPTSCAANGGTASPGRQLKLVNLTVKDGSSTAKVLLAQSSTFDQSNG